MKNEVNFDAPKIYNSRFLTKSNPKEIRRLLHHFSIPKNSNGKSVRFDYGTAGFRYHNKVLPPIMARIAIFAGLRSIALDGEAVGMMITASHNPEVDNGIKISDSNGGMLPVKWEQMATDMANSDNPFEESRINDISGKPRTMVVHIGRDTRSHSLPLSQIAIRTLVAMGAKVIDHGVVTTPQLHMYTLSSNPHKVMNVLLCGSSSGTCFERDYMISFVETYVSLLRTCTRQVKDDKPRCMLVDSACGVGGLKLKKIESILKTYAREGGDIIHSSAMVNLKLVNQPGDGPLNHRCGAEYVQKNQLPPVLYSEFQESEVPASYVASLDGDADRIVFHYTDSRGKLVLLDGDKIAVLISSFLQEEIRYLSTEVPEAKKIKCGIVQTAYANGSSTRYLKNIVQTEVAIAKTGVKHVHEMAHHHFDVGTYFEANGHGTVLFGPKFYDLLAKAEQKLISTSRTQRATIAWQRLRLLPKLVNQAVGDALSDLLIIDAILYLNGWDLQRWSGLYNDMPSRQCKVKVKDRSIISTNSNETKTISPASLQPALEAAMESMNSISLNPLSQARTFVRPSGTEDAVRIYAEAQTQDEANLLATEAATLVYKLCNGVSEIPTLPGQTRL